MENPVVIEKEQILKRVEKTHDPSNVQDDLRDLLTCEICKEIYNEPVTLLCNHTYCQYCIHKLIEQSMPQNIPGNPIPFNRNRETENSCPKCMLKIWLPPLKHINYTLRDVIKTLYGEKTYEAVKKERSIGLVKTDIKEQAMEEIKEEMWRSISDTLNLQNPHGLRKSKLPYIPFNDYYGDEIGFPPPSQVLKKKHQLDLDPIDLPEDSVIPRGPRGHKGKPCYYYNTIKGCKTSLELGCCNEHRYDDNLIRTYFDQLGQQYPFLLLEDWDAPTCRAFNSLEGCMDENCIYVHIYDYNFLCNELERLRKIGLVHPKDIPEPETVKEFGKKMVLVFGILLGTYIWWRMKK